MKMEDKDAVRRRLRERLRSMSAAQRAEESGKICLAVRSLEEWGEATMVLGYMAQRDEPEIRPLMEEALRFGKTLCLPWYDAAAGRYAARRVDDLEASLVAGRFGILEPAGTAGEIPLKRLDLCLVPGLGFTLLGCRMGRGKGYYDRLLPESGGVRIGLAFECQMEPSLPVEAHDMGMDWIMTPSRRQQCQRRSAT